MCKILSFSEPHWFLSCYLREDLCLNEGLFVVGDGVFVKLKNVMKWKRTDRNQESPDNQGNSTSWSTHSKIKMISEQSIENILPSGRETTQWAPRGQEATPRSPLMLSTAFCLSLVEKSWSSFAPLCMMPNTVPEENLWLLHSISMLHSNFLTGRKAVSEIWLQDSVFGFSLQVWKLVYSRQCT